MAPVSKSVSRNGFKENLIYDKSRRGGYVRDLRPFPPVNRVFYCRDLFDSKDNDNERVFLINQQFGIFSEGMWENLNRRELYVEKSLLTDFLVHYNGCH